MSGTNRQFEWESGAPSDSGATKTLSTGMEVLDRKFGGGIPAGRIIALSATPASQSELFLYEMAGVRPTVYLTTERRVDDVHDSLEWAQSALDDVDVRRVGTDDPLGDARESLGDLPDGSTLIVDPMRVLERTGADAYRTFLNDLKARTAETGSLTLLHCLDGRRVPEQRDRTEYLADVIFSLSTTVRGGTLENSLSVPKFRGGQAFAEAVKLDLTADVTIDVTRKIA